MMIIKFIEFFLSLDYIINWKTNIIINAFEYIEEEVNEFKRNYYDTNKNNYYMKIQ